MWVDAWVFALIPVLVVALFFYGVLRIIGALLGGLGRVVRFICHPVRRRLPDRITDSKQASVSRVDVRVCPNHYCRRVNVAEARYCSQCGQRL
ncbi:MAG: hypothetical protein KAV82_12470 [Phycisphaerae bacterium]|nr:hypothetical protein [Phycisphaerae bacterium]